MLFLSLKYKWTYSALQIAVDLAEYAYRAGRASTYPEPEDKEAFIRSFLYDTDYEDFVPPTWDWQRS